MVGMTGLPEVVLARELGLCYASIALVTNYGAGLGQGPLTHTEVVRVMREGAGGLSALLRHVLAEAARLGCQTCRA